MNKKITPLLLLTHSLCWITTINTMETASAAAKLIEVNPAFVERHRASFETFIGYVRAGSVGGKIAKKVSTAVPFLGRVVKFVADSAAGYEDALEYSYYLDRFFQDEKQKASALRKLFEDRDYQNQATDFLSEVFKNLKQKPDQGRARLVQLVHEQNVRTLKQPEGTTQKAFCKKVASKGISDEDYFTTVPFILLAVYAYENSLHNKNSHTQ